MTPLTTTSVPKSHMTRVDSGADVNTDDMMRLFRRMDSQLKWDLVADALPSGTSKGKQSSKLYKGKCYRHVYFVDAVLSSRGGGLWPLGYGNDYEAIVWADRTKLRFDELDISGELNSIISAMGRDMAFYRIGGFMLAHEVLHSVGASHYGDDRSVMTRIPNFGWILRWPIVSQHTVN